MIKNIEDVPKNRKLVVFDLDGTLAESKSDIDDEMSELLRKLLERKKVAVIGGGKFTLFESQLLAKLHAPDEALKNLFLFPTTATAFYRYEEGYWRFVYSHDLTSEQKGRILKAFEQTFAELSYVQPEKIYGQLIEDRGSEITFSALGQEAPLELKEKWKQQHSDFKLKLSQTLQKHLPDMEVRVAGFTSIDVTDKGIDKEFGLKQIRDRLGITFNDMLFVGDALFPGGNDSAALRTGIPCFSVNGPEETKELLRSLIRS